MACLSRYSFLLAQAVFVPTVGASAPPWLIALIVVGAVLLIFLWFELSLGRVLFATRRNRRKGMRIKAAELMFPRRR